MTNIGYLLSSLVHVAWNFTTNNNFAQISPILTRSAQPNPKHLKEIVEKYKTKKIINLRGSNPESKWYQDEQETCQKLGLELINIRLTATAMPSQKNILEIIDAARKIDSQTHIHCKGGAERTGLFAGIYLLLNDFKPKEALKQVSLRFGVLNPYQRRFFRAYKKSYPQSLESWVQQTYDPTLPR